MNDIPSNVWPVAELAIGDQRIMIGIATKLYHADGWGFHIAIKDAEAWGMLGYPCTKSSDKLLHIIYSLYGYLPGFRWYGPIVTIIDSKLKELGARYGTQ